MLEPPPGAVLVGEGAALEAALLLSFVAVPFVEDFGSKLGSRFIGALGSAAGSVGPNDRNPPRLRDCAWLGDAVKLDGLTSVLP